MNRKNKFLQDMSEEKLDDLGISKREIDINNTKLYIFYIQELTDREKLSNQIIKPLVNYNETKSPNIKEIANAVIYIDNLSVYENDSQVINYILSGKSIIISPSFSSYIVTDTAKVEKRTTQSPEIENTLRGAKDSFTENMGSNISLIRYRIKDPNLRIVSYDVGKRTKTNVSIVYIDDVANSSYVENIKKRISNINVDGVLESGYVQKFILNNTFNLFPQAGIVERSDVACANILEGKVCVLVEGNNVALITPKTFIEFFDTSDDHYDNIYIGIFVKYIRLLSLFISLTLSALYVTLVAFNPDIIPPGYALALASARATVPFNALLEAMLMETITEILHEASIRLPKQIGPAIGIVGTIVIGQAAVSAGLVSPLMVIITALVTMCSFVAPDYTIMNPIRLLKFFIIFISGIFGLFGLTLGLILILINLVSQSTFGIPYLAPVAPFNFKDMKNYFLSDITLSKERPKYLNTEDKTRTVDPKGRN